MSEPENVGDRPKIKRDALGRVLPGQAPLTRNGGRPQLPEAFKKRGPYALAILTATALGEVVDDLLVGASEDVRKRVRDLATDTEPEVARKAANDMADRIFGKAAQAVEIEGGVTVTPLAEALLRIAQAATPSEAADEPDPSSTG